MLELILSAVQAILQVVVMVFFGSLLAKLGYYNNDKQRWLSKLNLVFFTPCLLFSNIASTISIEKLLAFWPIPMFHFTFCFLNFISSQILSRICGLDAPQRRFVTACNMFSNSNSLPIAIISSLAVSEAVHILYWGSSDTSEAVAARGISYTLFFAIFGNLIRWSYGYQLLQRHPNDVKQDEEVISKKVYNSISSSSSSSSSSSKSSRRSSSSSDMSVHLQVSRSGMPSRQLSYTTITVTDENTGLLLNAPTTKPKSLLNKIHSFMSPPLYAATFALIIGLSPLKPWLFNRQSFLYPSFTKAIESCGKAAVPLILTCLGAQLLSIHQEQQEITNKKPVMIAILIRMFLMPFLVVPTVILFIKFGSNWSMLASDPVFITIMIVLGCSPTAINLVQITQVNQIFEQELLHVLFWCYGVVCVPCCTLVVFTALNIVDKML